MQFTPHYVDENGKLHQIHHIKDEDGKTQRYYHDENNNRRYLTVPYNVKMVPVDPIKVHE